MARGDILRKLFKSFSQNDREEFQAAAFQLIQEEKEKNHILLAHDLERMLQIDDSKRLASNNLISYDYPDIPKDKDTGLPLIDVAIYGFTWDRVILSKKNLKILEKVVQENRKQDILEAYGLKPTSKLLFCGPPGCGKTITAKVVASVLNFPLVYINLPSVFSSYLGETSVNLKKIFDYVKRGQWVILFDEFDAIAKDRNTPNEHGEIQRLVNSLLQLIDNYQNNNILIAATNHESLLDTAVWRRFDEVIFFGKPNYHLRRSLLRKYLSSMRHPGLEIEKFASRLRGTTGADIERICNDAIKSVLLKNKNVLMESDLEEAVKRNLERMQIVEMSTKSLDQFIEEEEEEENDSV